MFGFQPRCYVAKKMYPVCILSQFRRQVNNALKKMIEFHDMIN